MQDLLLMFIQIKTTSIKMQYNLLIYHMVLIIFRASNLFILYLPHGNIMGEISSLLSVCLGSISSETAEQMWLIFCTKVVCLDTAFCVLVAVTSGVPQQEPQMYDERHCINLALINLSTIQMSMTMYNHYSHSIFKLNASKSPRN